MKKTITTLVLTTASSIALAGGTIDLRANHVSSTVDNNGAKTSTAGFALDRVRIGFSGKLNDSVSGKAQLYHEVSSGTATFGLKYAEVSNKLNDQFTLSMGKIDDAGLGGFESLRTSADQYFMSLNHKHGYTTGANLNYNFAENQNLLFNFMNEDENAANTGVSNGYGLRWLGGFDSSNVVLSYHMVPASTGKNLTYLAAGYQYKASPLTVSLDYLAKTTKTTTTGAGAADGTSNSVVLMADYDMGMFVPNLKYESSLTKNADSTTEEKQTQYSIGTHIVPNAGDNFRYQVEYVGKTTNAGTSGAKDVNTTTIYVGARLVADFLK